MAAYIYRATVLLILSFMISIMSVAAQRIPQRMGPKYENRYCSRNMEDAYWMRDIGHTYTFWGCTGLALEGESSCECMIVRIEHVVGNQVIGINENEYLSESSCNRNCGRADNDKCYVCTSEERHVGGGNLMTVRDCKHVSEVTASGTITSGRFTSQNCRKCFYLEAECIRI